MTRAPTGEPAWLNAAGGFRYHLRAFSHSQKLWADFRWQIGQWLLSWVTREPTLLLVGPSAGYNLQVHLLERFERIVVLEPDPLARFIFQRRIRKARLDREPRLEFVAEDQLVFHPERFGPFVDGLGLSAILFCNVLGQLRPLLGDEAADGPAFTRVRAAVRDAIHGRSWASFHDRVSGALVPALVEPVPSNHRWTDLELVEQAFPGISGGPNVALYDHCMEGFFPEDLSHLYLRWELAPGVFHVIEAVASDRA